LDNNEIGLGIEIIFAGLVNHPDIAFLSCFFVRDSPVNLSSFEIFAVLVLHAQGEKTRFRFLLHD
jgi:hypothetical protein